MNDMLSTMIRYQGWADAEFLDKLMLIDTDRHGVEYRSALRLLDHINVVARIFAAHLMGELHGLRSDTTEPTPAIDDLRETAARTNRWYLDYVHTARPDALAERVRFTFTDGDSGCMSRQEMLTHVVLHGAVHRGEVGRILAQIGAAIPWDTFAVLPAPVGADASGGGSQPAVTCLTTISLAVTMSASGRCQNSEEGLGRIDAGNEWALINAGADVFTRQ